MSAGRAEFAPVSGEKHGTSVLRMSGSMPSMIGVPMQLNRPKVSGSMRKPFTFSSARFTS